MNIESIISMLGGGVGVFTIKLYTDWRQAKRGDTKDVIGAWQQIADRESQRLHVLEERIATLEKLMLEKDEYINKMEHLILQANLRIPDQ